MSNMPFGASDISVMNFVALFDLTFGAMHEAAQTAVEDDRTVEFMKELIEIKRRLDNFIKRETP